MPWIIQMAGFALMMLGIAVALWMSVWVLLFFFVVGILGVAWSHLRGYLMRKGIVNASIDTAAEPFDTQQNMTVIDAEFSRVDEEKK